MRQTDLKFIDNSDAVVSALKLQKRRALERCGEQAEGYAKDICPVDTSNLRNSITHAVDSGAESVAIGTNSDYAIYVEAGTGIYHPGGRQDPWAFKDANGKWHMTRGQEAQPYLKPAVADHEQTYRNIIKDELKNG